MERCWSGDKQSRGVVHQLGGGGGGEWLTGHKRPTEFRRVCLRNPNAYQTPTMNASSSTISNTHQQAQQSYLQIHPNMLIVVVVHAVLIVVVWLLLLLPFFFSVLCWCSCSVSRKHDRDAESNHPWCVFVFVFVFVFVCWCLCLCFSRVSSTISLFFFTGTPPVYLLNNGLDLRDMSPSNTVHMLACPTCW